VTATYLDRLAARSASVGSVLCLGLDPDPASLPHGFPRDLAGVEAFVALIVEAAAPYAAAVKPNLAFFEAFGSAGLASRRAMGPSERCSSVRVPPAGLHPSKTSTPESARASVVAVANCRVGISPRDHVAQGEDAS
jgi:hypothetical protein